MLKRSLFLLKWELRKHHCNINYYCFYIETSKLLEKHIWKKFSWQLTCERCINRSLNGWRHSCSRCVCVCVCVWYVCNICIWVMSYYFPKFNYIINSLYFSFASYIVLFTSIMLVWDSSISLSCLFPFFSPESCLFLQTFFLF